MPADIAEIGAALIKTEQGVALDVHATMGGAVICVDVPDGPGVDIHLTTAQIDALLRALDDAAAL
jgi:hypothetical protein